MRLTRLHIDLETGVEPRQLDQQELDNLHRR